jgi:hypothetical protein
MEATFNPNVRRAPQATFGHYNPPSVLDAGTLRAAKGPGIDTPDIRLTKDSSNFGYGHHARSFDTGGNTHPARTTTPARNVLISNRRKIVKGQETARPDWSPTTGTFSPLKAAGSQMSKSWSAPQHGKRWLEKKREQDMVKKSHKLGSRRLNVMKQKRLKDQQEAMQHLDQFTNRMTNMENEVEYIDTHYSAKEVKDNIKSRGIGGGTDASSTFSPPKYRGETSKLQLCSQLASNNFSKGTHYALERPSTRANQRAKRYEDRGGGGGGEGGEREG